MAQDGEAGRLEPLRAVLVTRNRGWAVSAGVVFAVALLLFALSDGEPWDFLALVAFAGTFAFVPLAAWLAYHAPRRRDVTVRVDERGLHFRRRGAELGLVRERSRLRRGEAIAMPDGRYRVDLHTRLGPRVRLELDGHEQARALLAALGLDRREGTTRFRLRWHPPVHGFAVVATVVVAVFALMLAGLGAAWVIGGLILAGVMPLLDSWLFRVDLTIGVDGIETTRGSGARRFIPHGRIVRVAEIGSPPLPGHEIVSPGFRVVLDDGEVLAFDTRDERFRTGVWKTDPVFEAAHAAWRNARGPSAAQAAATALLRGRRSTGQWIASLRELGRDEARSGYRIAAIDERTLFDVVADAQAPSELRAAAAVALGAHADHAQRLRVVADDLAEPAVRSIALRAASAATASELEEAMEIALERRGGV